MKPYMFFLLLCLSLGCLKAEKKSVYEPYLAMVDSLLEQENYRKFLHDSKIRSLRQQVGDSRTEDEMYLINRLLVEAYKTYISDSAIAYLDRNEELAYKLNNERYLVETLLDKAYVYSAVGSLDQAEECLERLRCLPLTEDETVAYYVQSIYYYNHLDNLYHRYRYTILSYCDSILVLEKDSGSDDYLWARYWKECENEDTSELRGLLKDRIELMDDDTDDGYYGNLCFALSTLLSQVGDEEQAFLYMIRSLISDIKRNNNDSAALHIIASKINDEGEFLRAYKYLQYGLRQQSAYPDRAHVYSLMESMQNIYDMVLKHTEEESLWRQHTIFGLIALSVLLFLALAFLLYLRRQQLLAQKQLDQKNETLDQSLQELNQIQGQLKLMNTDLQEKNAKIAAMNALLLSANHVKEEHIANLFTQCSGYITKINEFRKNIYRKLKAKQYDDLLRQTASSDVIVANEVQELYKNFDALFLNIYPNFIQDLNTLLRPEEQIAPRNDDTLTNDLRIFALVRLGINNSTKIAAFLHLSPQTVYNSRMKMRSKATPSDLEFPERVSQLGRLSKGDPVS